MRDGEGSGFGRGPFCFWGGGFVPSSWVGLGFCHDPSAALFALIARTTPVGMTGFWLWVRKCQDAMVGEHTSGPPLRNPRSLRGVLRSFEAQGKRDDRF